MIYFHNDYSEGCHEKVMQALIHTNMEQTPGYGTDDYCYAAADKIRKAVSSVYKLGGIIVRALKPKLNSKRYPLCKLRQKSCHTLVNTISSGCDIQGYRTIKLPYISIYFSQPLNRSICIGMRLKIRNAPLHAPL